MYSAKSAYNALFLGQHTTEGVKELWKVRVPGKCRMSLARLAGACLDMGTCAAAWLRQPRPLRFVLTVRGDL
jgi:hypothetical protein